MVEQCLDELYDKYIQESAKYRIGISVRNKERRNKLREEIPEDLADFSKFAESQQNDWYSDDESIEGTPNELLVTPQDPNAESQKVSMWFDDEDIFQNIGEEEDDVEDMKKK